MTGLMRFRQLEIYAAGFGGNLTNSDPLHNVNRVTQCTNKQKQINFHSSGARDTIFFPPQTLKPLDFQLWDLYQDAGISC